MRSLQTLLLSVFIFNAFTVVAQEENTATVEKSLFNVQVGTFGLFVNHEAGLTNTIALRTEVGLDAGFYVGQQTGNEVKFMAGPSINIEPRWYYNISKRAGKGRNTSNNAANFIGLSIKYIPDWFTLSNDHGGRENNIADQIVILPKWSIRRNIGNSKFNYELGFGLGYQYVFLKQYGYRENNSQLYADIHARIGYAF